jgi:riboflavin kinase / FMN adenylyltransferase
MMSEGRPVFRASLDECLPGERVATIGMFDGVHLGHQFLLETTVARARASGVPSVVITFEPPPALILRPDLFSGRICLPAEKLNRIALTGVDEIVTVRFDLELAALSPEAFMKQVMERLSPREIWVGEAFALGKNRSGDVGRLREIGETLGYELHSVERVSRDDKVVSSSLIRAAILAGRVDAARELLGRPFRISGEVIHGAHLGRQIGFPTANVAPPPELVPLIDGIYVSLGLLPGETTPRPAMTYIGTRPVVNPGDRLIETHFLDFDGDLYGQVIDVDFLARIRADQIFDGLDSLIAQLKVDEETTRAVLAEFSIGEEQ